MKCPYTDFEIDIQKASGVLLVKYIILLKNKLHEESNKLANSDKELEDMCRRLNAVNRMFDIEVYGTYAAAYRDRLRELNEHIEEDGELLLKNYTKEGAYLRIIQRLKGNNRSLKATVKEYEELAPIKMLKKLEDRKK